MQHSPRSDTGGYTIHTTLNFYTILQEMTSMKGRQTPHFISRLLLLGASEKLKVFKQETVLKGFKKTSSCAKQIL